MKKLSIVLALIMALSCFGITAFAEEASTEATTAAEPAKVVINVQLIAVDGTLTDTIVLNYEAAAGTTLTSADILAAVKSRLGDEEVDVNEYVISETVVAYDDVDLDNAQDDPYKFSSTKVVAGIDYKFDVIANEIDDVKNLAVTIGEQLAKIDWAGITKYNVTLINQIINGTKAAIESLVNAEWPECTEKAEETTVEATEEPEIPDTGVSAVAGAAVVVLALSATTAVVLRKKED